MFIESITVNNFRNHLYEKIVFSNKINYITGYNGSGKTSIVEAIHTALNSRSFKTNQLKKIINFNTDYFSIDLTLVKEELRNNIKFQYINNISNLYQNKKKVRKISDFIYEMPILVYSPENEGLLSNSQDKKRRFLDRICFYFDKAHFHLLKNYNKLQQIKKNILYKGVKDYLYIKAVTEEMDRISNNIQQNRYIVISKINDKIVELCQSENSVIENFSFDYKSSVLDTGLLNKEINNSKIYTGAHLDKIYVIFKGIPYENFASFGQKKIFGIASVISSVLIVEEILKDDIIVVLDDLEVGLDEMRIDFLKSFFDNNQLFITGVENKYFDSAKTIKLNSKSISD